MSSQRGTGRGEREGLRSPLLKLVERALERRRKGKVVEEIDQLVYIVLGRCPLLMQT